MKKLGMRFSISKHRDIKDATLNDWWQEYDALFFESGDLKKAYDHQVSQLEPRQIPSGSRQIFNLSRWLK